MRARKEEVDDFAKLSDVKALKSLKLSVTRLSTENCKSLSEARYNDLREWLSIAPYYSHHDSVLKCRLQNAGRWLLDNPVYGDWKDSSCSSLLLLHGIPGSGKSTLSSVIIESFLHQARNQRNSAPFAYFYCDNVEFERARRSSADILRTVLFQLASDPEPGPKMKDILCSEYQNRLSISRNGKVDLPKPSVNDCIRLILQLAEQDPLTIVIDGIDTCDEQDRLILIEALRRIVQEANNVVKVFVSSRTTGRAAALPDAECRIEITAQETREDMETYVQYLVQTALKRKSLLGGQISPQLLEMLSERLISGAGEM